MSNIPIDTTWQNSGFDPSELSEIASALGFQSIDDPGMPPLSQLTDNQLLTISGIVDPSTASKLATLMSGVSNPPLLEPDESFDVRDMMLMLAQLNRDLGELGAAFAKEGILIDKQKLQEISARRMKKLQKAIRKARKAKNSGKLTKIMGWVGVAAGLVAAGALIALTGGAATALVAFAVAYYGAVFMTLQETGAMDKILNFVLQDASNSAKDKWKMGIMIGIQAALLIAGIASGVGAASAINNLSTTTTLMVTAVNVSKTAAIVGAGAGAVGGVSGMVSADAQYKSTNAQADSKEFQAWIKSLQAAVDQQTEELQAIMEKLGKMAFQTPSDVMDGVVQSIQSIASQRMSSV